MKELICFICKGKFGCKKSGSNTVVIPPIYQAIEIHYTGSILALSGFKWGVLDKDNNVLIPFKHQQIIPVDSDLFCCKEEDKWSLKSVTRKDVFSDQYDGIWPLRKELFCVAKNRKYGVVSLSGDEVLPCCFDSIRLVCNNHLFLVSIIGRKLCFSLDGKSIPLKCISAYDRTEEHGTFLGVEKGGLWGVVYKIDEEHCVEILPCEYSDVNRKSSQVTSSTSTSRVIPLVLHYDYNNDTLFLVSIKSGNYFLYGYVDWYHDYTIPLVFEDAMPFNGTSYAAVQLKGKWGIIDRKGKWLSLPRWDAVEVIRSEDHQLIPGIIAVNKDSKWGVYSINGKELLPCEFTTDYLTPFIPERGKQDKKLEGAFLFGDNDGLGVVSKKGRIIIKPHYDRIRYPVDGICAVRKNGKWGYYDLINGEIVPCSFTEVEDFSQGLGVMHSIPPSMFRNPLYKPSIQDGKSIVVDCDGKDVFSASSIIRISEDLFWIGNDTRQFIANSLGEVVFELSVWDTLEDRRVSISVERDRVFIGTKNSLYVYSISEKRVLKTVQNHCSELLFNDGLSRFHGSDIPSFIDFDGNIAEDYRFSLGYCKEYLADDENLKDLKPFWLICVSDNLFRYPLFMYATSKEKAEDAFYHSCDQFWYKLIEIRDCLPNDTLSYYTRFLAP